METGSGVSSAGWHVGGPAMGRKERNPCLLIAALGCNTWGRVCGATQFTMHMQKVAETRQA
jgi:hypothetical protein